MVQSPEMDNKGYLSADRVWPFENTLTPAWSLQVAQIGYDTLFFFLFSFFLRSAEMLCLQHGVHMMEMTAEGLGGIKLVDLHQPCYLG